MKLITLNTEDGITKYRVNNALVFSTQCKVIERRDNYLVVTGKDLIDYVLNINCLFLDRMKIYSKIWYDKNIFIIDALKNYNLIKDNKGFSVKIHCNKDCDPNNYDIVISPKYIYRYFNRFLIYYNVSFSENDIDIQEYDIDIFNKIKNEISLVIKFMKHELESLNENIKSIESYEQDINNTKSSSELYEIYNHLQIFINKD